MSEAGKVKLTISGVLQDLADGLDRKAIKEKYGLTATDVSRLFEHEKLKGKRVRKAAGFELIDDTADSVVDDAVKVAVEKKAKKVTKAAVAEVAQTEAPVTSTAQAEVVTEKEQEKEEEAEVDVKEESIKEVKGEEEADEIDTKKGLW